MAKCHFDAALAGDANKVGGTKEGANESVNEAQPQVINKNNVEDCRFTVFRGKRDESDRDGGITNTHPLRQPMNARNAYRYITGPWLKERTLEIRRLVAESEEAEELSRAATERGDQVAATEWSKKAQKFKDEAQEKKSWLPYVTFGGVFTERDNAHLVKYSGLMCFDIDNLPSPERMEEVKRTLLASVYFHTVLLFVSPRGRGLKWVVRVELGDYDYTYYYKAVQQYLKSIGIKADHTSDISRPCFLCWDPNCYFAEGDDERERKTFIPEDWLANGQNGKSVERQAQLPLEQQRVVEPFAFVQRTPELDREVDDLVRRLVEERIDITVVYKKWVALAFAFASYYGWDEQGWQHFRAISQFYPRYSESECFSKYKNIVKDDQGHQCWLARLSEEERAKELEKNPLITIKTFIYAAEKALAPLPQPDPEHPYSFGNSESNSTEQESQDNWLEEFCNDLDNENNDEK